MGISTGIKILEKVLHPSCLIIGQLPPVPPKTTTALFIDVVGCMFGSVSKVLSLCSSTQIQELVACKLVRYMDREKNDNHSSSLSLSMEKSDDNNNATTITAAGSHHEDDDDIKLHSPGIIN